MLTGTRALQRTGHVLHRRRAHARSGARHAPLGAGALRLARVRVRLHPQLGRLAVLVPRARARRRRWSPTRATAFADLLGYVTPRRPRADEPRRSAPLAAAVGARRGRARVRPARAAARRAGTPEARRTTAISCGSSRLSLGAIAPAPKCDTTFDGTPATSTPAPPVRQFMSLIRLAFACDLTRIVTFSAPVPQCPELGYPADATFHGYAHQSIVGTTSCGQMYSAATPRRR